MSANKTLAQKEKELANIRSSIQQMNKQIEPLSIKAVRLHKEIQTEKFNNLLPLTLEKLLTTNVHILDCDKGFKAVDELVRSYSGIYISGYNIVTETKWVQMMFNQNKDFETQKNDIVKFINNIVYQTQYSKGNTPTTDEQKMNLPAKYRLLGVFHNETRFDGLYNVAVDENNQATLINTRYYSTKVVKTLPLDEMLKYIYDNHPYEALETEEESNDFSESEQDS